MATMAIENVPDEMVRALQTLAIKHKRTIEAEILAILDAAAFPPERLKIGTALVDLFRPFGGIDLDIDPDRAPLGAAENE